jgi:outer membrane lipoprotein-sorting protein
MSARERFYRFNLSKKISFLSKIILIFFFSTNIFAANLQNKLIEKLLETKTLTFNFKQIIAGKKEVGNCFIKYPLLMKCNYNNKKQKIIISNGIKVAIIKKKYKKIYSYPIKSTPLFFLLKKEKIVNLIKETKPLEILPDLIEFKYIGKKNEIKIFFSKKTLDLKGWETNDAYSNKVSFIINNLKINNQIVDSFFKVPLEEDL